MVAGAISTLATLGLSLPSGTPAPLNVTTNQPCVSATVTCTTLQMLGAFSPAPGLPGKPHRRPAPPADLSHLPRSPLGQLPATSPTPSARPR